MKIQSNKEYVFADLGKERKGGPFLKKLRQSYVMNSSTYNSSKAIEGKQEQMRRNSISKIPGSWVMICSINKTSSSRVS